MSHLENGLWNPLIENAYEIFLMAQKNLSPLSKTEPLEVNEQIVSVSTELSELTSSHERVFPE